MKNQFVIFIIWYIYSSCITAQVVEKLCTTARSDIAFVVDASTSIGDANFELQRRFMLDLINRLNIHAEFVRVAMIRFSTSTEVIFNWSNDRNYIEQMIRGMAYTTGWTRTGDALQQANMALFQQNRDDVTKVVILITDGQSNGGGRNPIIEANLLKDQDVQLISVGIGSSLNANELRAISSRNTYYHIQDFQTLSKHVEKLINQTCITIFVPKASALPPEFRNISKNFVCPVEVCSAKKGNVLFLLDMSVSIGKDLFQTQLEFILNMVYKLDIGYDKLGASLIMFGNNVTLIFKGLEDKNEIEKQIKLISYLPGNGATAKALRVALEQVFVNPQLGESSLLFLLTDGMSETSYDEIYKEADSLKNHGVTIVTIAIGEKININVLRVVSSEKMLYEAKNPKEIQELFKKEVTMIPPTASPESPNLDKISHYSRALKCPNEVCGVPEMYFAILLDSNDSVGEENLQLQITFIKNLLKKLNIGKNKVVVSLITFSGKTNKIFGWLNDSNEIEYKINSLRFSNDQGRAMGDAFKRARDELFASGQTKIGVKKLILLITSGKHSTFVDPKDEAETLKSNKVKIVTIAVGHDIDNYTLSGLSSPNLFFSVSTFDDLSTVFIQEPFSKDDPCPIEVCSVPQMDLAILLDNSRWIGSTNFNTTLKFVNRIVKTLNISSLAVRISLITFSDKVEVNLKWSGDKETIINKINYAKDSRSSATEIGNALEKAKKELFINSRSNVQKTILLITNGRPRGKLNHKKFADELKLMNISIITVGIIQDADREELTAISSPENQYFVKEYDDLDHLFIKEEFDKEEPCPVAICSLAKADFVFLLDATLEKEKYIAQIQFMSTIIMRINKKDIRIAIILVGSNNGDKSEWTEGNEIQNYVKSLEKRVYENSNSILQFVSYTENKNEGLGDGLKQAREELFNNGRQGVERVLMLLSDGTNVGSVNPIKEAGFLKDANVSIVAVAIGDEVDRPLLNAVSSPNMTYCVKSIKDIITVFRDPFSIPTSPPPYQFSKKVGCPQEICSKSEIDLVFLLGVGEDITETNFQLQLIFLREIVKKLGNEHRIALVTFDSNVTVVFDWLDNKNEILSQLQNVSYSTNVMDEGEGAMAQALRVTHEHLFTKLPYYTSKVVLLLDNGITSSSFDQLEEANTLKDNYVTILTVAVGERVDRYLLKAISSTNMVYITENYYDLVILFDSPLRPSESDSAVFQSQWQFIVVAVVSCFSARKFL